MRILWALQASHTHPQSTIHPEKRAQVLFVQTFLRSVRILCSISFPRSCLSDRERHPEHASLLVKEQNRMKMEREGLQ